MSNASSRALSIARPAIQLLTALNIAYAVAIAGLLAYSFLIPGWPDNPFGGDVIARYPYAPNGLRMIIVIGIAGALVVHGVLRKLVAIIDTVRAGDPFTFENARRLELIAWSALSLELLRVCVVAIAAAVYEPGKIAGFTLAPWLAVLLLFVLAGVFAQGARMRAELEGTV